MTEKQAAKKIAKLLHKHFGDDYATRERIEKSVWEGDPYGWTNGALATIGTEDCLPDPCYGPLEAYCRFYEDCWAVGLHCEPINGAVIGVYPN